MFSINNLGKHHGGQTLFTEATVSFNAGSRYGVVGANGSGKSTILRIIGGVEEASEGEVNIPGRATVGWLKQDHFAYESVPIIEVVLMGNTELYEAMVEKEKLLENADESFDADRYSELEDVILKHDGYSQEAVAAELLEGLNIPGDKHREPMSSLSGGYKLRVLLAQTLASKPDILLLDEPTNHLDIVSAFAWLENFLMSYRGLRPRSSAHDHGSFLDSRRRPTSSTSTTSSSRVYTGNYEDFERLKAEAPRARKEAEIEKREAGDRRPQEVHRSVQGQGDEGTPGPEQDQKRMEKIEIVRLPESSRRYPTFKLQQAPPQRARWCHRRSTASPSRSTS